MLLGLSLIAGIICLYDCVSAFLLNPCTIQERRSILFSSEDTKLGRFTRSIDSMPEAEIIDGKSVAASIRLELKDTVSHLVDKYGVTPGLAFVLVGNRRDSATYVRMKQKACEEVGITNFGFTFPENVAQDELLSCIMDLNLRSDVHGILVQLPLPSHINETAVIDSVLPGKDVDGLHPVNVAKLSMGHVFQQNRDAWSFEMLDFHVPCTPQGCIELLDRSGVIIDGKHAVVLGRSNIVGIPVSMLLLHRNATVTILHSRSTQVSEIVRTADILVAAVGKAEMVKSDWLKPGAVVIDVGINTIDDTTKKAGYRLVGDVDFDNAKLIASKITPVPGGVGPMTIAMLLKNTVNGASRILKALNSD